MSNHLSDEKKEELAKLAPKAPFRMQSPRVSDSSAQYWLTHAEVAFINAAREAIPTLIEENAELREIGREQAVTLHNVLNHTREFEDCDIQRCAEWQKIPVTELMKQRVRAAEAERDKLAETLQSISDFAVGHGEVCEIIARRARAALKNGAGVNDTHKD